MIRKYGFKTEDFTFDARHNLSLGNDPKECWAKNHPGFYPVKVNRADREALLRVPGFGPLTVSRILGQRRASAVEHSAGSEPAGEPPAKSPGAYPV